MKSNNPIMYPIHKNPFSSHTFLYRFINRILEQSCRKDAAPRSDLKTDENMKFMECMQKCDKIFKHE